MLACAAPNGSTKSVAHASDPERDERRRQAREAPAGVEAADAVAGSRGDDGEPAGDRTLAAAQLEADEQHDADEAEHDAGEPARR